VIAGQERYKKKAVVKRPSDADITAPRSQVLMIFRPAGRFLTIPFPPRPFAARFLAAVILPPLLFFAIGNPFLLLRFNVHCCAAHIAQRIGPCLWGVTLLTGGAYPKATSLEKDASITTGTIVYSTAEGLPFGMPVAVVASTNTSLDALFEEATLSFAYDVNGIQSVLIEK